MVSIWTDDQIRQWSINALGHITIDLNCIWAREAIDVQRGNSLIHLPNYVRSLSRITWRGRSLEPQSFYEFQLLTPSTMVVGDGNTANRDVSIGKPMFYALHPTNPYDVRLYPAPNETLLAAGEPDPYAPTPNPPSCVLSYWRCCDLNLDNPNPVISLPPYILRRLQKAYVLWQAFQSEGKGQDLQAAQYYQDKYEFIINQFRSINEGCYVSKNYALGEGMLDPQKFRYPKPTLGPNFERVIF
jgi:hypothetical protein